MKKIILIPMFVILFVSLVYAADPIITSVGITPLFPSIADDLIATTVYSDGDSDNMTLWWKWYQNDVLNATNLIEDDLISYWSLNGDTFDYYGTNDGTWSGSASYPTGKVGGSADFDGSTDYITIIGGETGGHDFVGISESMSVSLWIKPATVPAGNVPNHWIPTATIVELIALGKDVPLNIGLDSSKVSLGTWDGSGIGKVFSDTTIIAGNWYHVIFTISGDTYILYLNGGFEKTGTLAATGERDVEADNTYLRIGMRTRGDLQPEPTQAYDGIVDELMIFNGVLTATEASQLYHGSAHGGSEMNSSQTADTEEWYVNISVADPTSGFIDFVESNKVIIGSSAGGGTATSLLQVWRNKTNSINVSTIDSDGNWMVRGILTVIDSINASSFIGDINIFGDLNINGSLNITGNVSISGDFNVTQNVKINGNVSYQNPHLAGYDNSTQHFEVLETAQPMNISNMDYHSHQIDIEDHQNITFERKGHYEICISPEFYQASGNNKWITFWLQENGTNVPWSNSRYTMDNEEYFAPHICWRTIITNPDDEDVRIMWLSDSTDSQIISIDGLIDPVRPGIPGVITDITWISNGD